MNTELRKKAKRDFEKDFIKLINNAIFGKTLKNGIFFSENLLAMEVKQRKLLMNKPVYLDLLILKISKLVMHEF